MKGIFCVKELGAYVSKKYFEKYAHSISPVRLQKTLYFLFAYWGGFVRKGKMQHEQEIDVSQLSEILYDARIEAWVYGPVIPEVYFEQNIDQYSNDSMFDNKQMIKKFIDNVIDETFEINDFKLVDISHSDNAWISKFDYEEQFHNNEIDIEDIIKEYAKK